VEEAVLSALADDLDAPTALTIVQDWVDATLGRSMLADHRDSAAAKTVRRVMDAALGLVL
jgi:L-cysteine:1D-myo-inositol 2-amino-2-deoxy-alpha-D-glucopyranoside ligase